MRKNTVGAVIVLAILMGSLSGYATHQAFTQPPSPQETTITLSVHSINSTRLYMSIHLWNNTTIYPSVRPDYTAVSMMLCKIDDFTQNQSRAYTWTLYLETPSLNVTVKITTALILYQSTSIIRNGDNMNFAAMV